MSESESTCSYCGEPLLPGERIEELGQRRHWECAVRVAVGSVGHQQGICSCPGMPGLMDDPPGMSRREAAEAALRYIHGIEAET